MKRNNFIKALIGLPLVLSQLSFTKKEPKKEVTFFTPEMLSRNNYGLFIINSKVKEINKENIGYAATMAWKLCWHLTPYQAPVREHEKECSLVCNKYCKVNVFTDGWVCPTGNDDKETCEYLNNNPYKEKFRLMTKEEVIYLISNRKQGFL